MAEKIVIAQLDIDYDAAVKDTSELKNEISQLTAQLKETTESTGKSSAETVKYESALRAAKAELRTQQKFLDNLEKTQSKEVGTIKKLEAQNALLRKEQSQLNLETDKGVQRNEEIVKSINQNYEAVQNLRDEQSKGYAQVGQYQKGMEGLGGVMPGVAGGIDNVKGKMNLLAKSPLLLFVTALVGAFALLRKAFNRNEASTNKLNAVIGKLSGLFNMLLKALEPVVNYIVEYVIDSFETLGKVTNKVIGWVSSGLKTLGFDEAAKSVDNFVKKVNEATEAGEELAIMYAELTKAQRTAEKVQLDYQRRAEKIRQLRDDESKSIQERVKLNAQLNKVLSEQSTAELAIAQKGLDYANKKIELEGATSDNLDLQAEKLLKISEIQERITSQESEYLSNINGLRNEQKAKDKEIADAKAAELKRQADMQEKATAAAIKALDDEYAKWLEVNEKRIAKQEEFNILNLEKEQEYARLKLEQNLISQQEYNTLISESQLIFEENERIRKQEAEAINFENDLEVKSTNYYAELDAQRAKLDRQMKEELAYADKIGADKGKIEEKYAAAKNKIDEMQFNYTLDVAAQTANNLVTIFGEVSTAGKIAATASTTISTLQSAVDSFKAMAGIPYVGPILGGIAAAAALVAGYAAVDEIWSVDTSMSSVSKPSTSSSSGYSSVGSKISSASTSAVSNLNTQLGQGIVARDTGVVEQETPSAEKVLVIDEVTSAQNVEAEKVILSEN